MASSRQSAISQSERQVGHNPHSQQPRQPSPLTGSFQKKNQINLYQTRPEFKEALKRLRASVRSAGLIGLMELKRQFKIYQKDAHYLDKVRRANLQVTGSEIGYSRGQGRDHIYYFEIEFLNNMGSSKEIYFIQK